MSAKHCQYIQHFLITIALIEFDKSYSLTYIQKQPYSPQSSVSVSSAPSSPDSLWDQPRGLFFVYAPLFLGSSTDPSSLLRCACGQSLWYHIVNMYTSESVGVNRHDQVVRDIGIVAHRTECQVDTLSIGICANHRCIRATLFEPLSVLLA